MENKPVMIIAEAGVNHNGNIDLAYKLIDAAVDAGADYIKFQTFKSENLVTKKATMAQYQKENLKKEESQLAMLKKLELSQKDFLNLNEYCHKKGIKFLSTAFDFDSLIFLEELGVPFWKIPSGEITNLPYLEFCARTSKPIVLSTGMASLEEIRDAINVLIKNGTDKKNISVLHCNTDYPTKYEDVNLNAMKTIKEQLGVNIGYSDHTAGVEVSVAAVALGAKVIEKHFTLDQKMEGPDHKASLSPEELKRLVFEIRNIEKALGRAEKIPTDSEAKNIQIARKSIVAKKKISKGEIFTVENLTVKRPGTGISPMKWYSVLGTISTKDYDEDDLI